MNDWRDDAPEKDVREDNKVMITLPVRLRRRTQRHHRRRTATPPLLTPPVPTLHHVTTAALHEGT
jgi:hypothetical protein